MGNGDRGMLQARVQAGWPYVVEYKSNEKVLSHTKLKTKINKTLKFFPWPSYTILGMHMPVSLMDLFKHKAMHASYIHTMIELL